MFESEAEDRAVGLTGSCLEVGVPARADDEGLDPRRQLVHHALVVRVVERRVPLEPIGELDRRHAQKKIDTLVRDLSGVDGLSGEAGRRRDGNSEDLVSRNLVVTADVEGHAAIQNSELESDFVGRSLLRLEIGVGDRVLGREPRLIRDRVGADVGGDELVRVGIVAHLRNGRAQLGV